MEDYYEQSHFEEFENLPVRRRKLLPWWVRFFCWMFVIWGVLATIAWIAVFTGTLPDISIYGIDGDKSLLHTLIVIPVLMLHGLAGYLLWFEKKSAIIVGKISAVTGIVVCIASIAWSIAEEGFTFRFEIILLILFLHRLIKISDEWERGKASV